jgi:hypothetical protein
VDIFFPTNFGLLQQLDSYVAERASGKDGLSERLSTVVILLNLEGSVMLNI